MDHRTNRRVSFSDRPTASVRLDRTANEISKKTSEKGLTANHVDINRQTTHNAKKKRTYVHTRAWTQDISSMNDHQTQAKIDKQTTNKQIAKQTILTRKALKQKIKSSNLSSPPQVHRHPY
jgi:hypothetical protein